METIQRTSFSISNDTEKEMLIIHDPEGFEFLLPVGEEVIIEVDSVPNAILMKNYVEEGQCIIQLLGNSSLYRVLYQGIDAFKEYLE